MASCPDSRGRAYQTIALVVGHIWRQASRQCLLKSKHVTLSGCIVHSSRKCNYFRRLGGRLIRLVTHGDEYFPVVRRMDLLEYFALPKLLRYCICCLLRAGVLLTLVPKANKLALGLSSKESRSLRGLLSRDAYSVFI